MPRLEHIGIAVEEVDAVLECFEELLGARPYKSETVPDQQVRTHFLDADTAKLELLEALDDESPVQRFLDRRGEGLHHLAFEVTNIQATMHRLRDAGFELLSDAPAAGADDKDVFFVHPKQTHGVLVEFCSSMFPSWSPSRIPRHDGHLSVFERGNPNHPPLLLLHGAAGSTLYETAPLMRQLESSFRPVGVDLSGHGASAFPPDESLTMDTFVDDAVAALDAVDAPSAHVFGFSLGGAVALRLAQRTPNRVNRLALFQTNAQWNQSLTAKMQRRLDLDALQQRDPERADDLRSLHNYPERLFEELRAFTETLPVSPHLWNGLPSIQMPTLVSSVDRDPLFGEIVPRTLQHRLPNARLAILPGEHHSLTRAPISLLAPLITRHLLDE